MSPLMVALRRRLVARPVAPRLYSTLEKFFRRPQLLVGAGGLALPGPAARGDDGTTAADVSDTTALSVEHKYGSTLTYSGRASVSSLE